MLNYENEINNLFTNMVQEGLVSTSNHWIEKAAEQKNPRLTLDLAYSNPLFYDSLDKILVNLKGSN